jgi:hypothetical protein
MVCSFAVLQNNNNLDWRHTASGFARNGTLCVIRDITTCNPGGLFYPHIFILANSGKNCSTGFTVGKRYRIIRGKPAKLLFELRVFYFPGFPEALQLSETTRRIMVIIPDTVSEAVPSRGWIPPIQPDIRSRRSKLSGRPDIHTPHSK